MDKETVRGLINTTVDLDVSKIVYNGEVWNRKELLSILMELVEDEAGEVR